jgi:hypothetical protein
MYHGKDVFASGRSSNGQGVTQDVKSIICEKTCTEILDLPGLDDLINIKKILTEVEKVLKQGGTFRLVFCLTLEEGRIRGGDLSTFHNVMTSIAAEFTFAVIVNKWEGTTCSEEAMKEQLSLIMETVLGRRVDEILFVPRLTSKDCLGKENLVVDDKVVENLRGFIDK